MQDGHDDLRRRPTFFGVNVYGDATPVVDDRDRLVCVDGDCNFLAVACERFVDRVIDDFENHVVEPGAVIGIPDIHAWPFAYSFETL
jgi:hypothetical protein